MPVISPELTDHFVRGMISSGADGKYPQWGQSGGGLRHTARMAYSSPSPFGQAGLGLFAKYQRMSRDVLECGRLPSPTTPNPRMFRSCEAVPVVIQAIKILYSKPFTELTSGVSSV